jgi:type IV pilus assembly protein PilW
MSPSLRQRYRSERGLSLIELLVSLAISLVIALAASMAYLGARGTATAVSNISQLNETGKLVLDFVDRELEMAGYYPAITSNGAGSTNLMGSFSNTKNAAVPAYNQGLFGCDGGRFNPVTGTCPAPTANAPDSVVVNYFAATELDATTFGSGFDCLRQAVSADPQNAAQIATGRPLYVSDRIGLSDVQTYTVPGPGQTSRTVSSRSLACNGNGKATEDLIYQPTFEGVVDMVFRYGAHNGTGSLSPETYRTATEISALPTVSGLTAWQRVTSVHVCVLTRSPENARNSDSGGAARSYNDCRGNVVQYAANDRTIYKRFERVVAIRNNLNGVY